MVLRSLGVLVRASLLLGAALSALRAEEPVDFGRDIRPILSDRCYPCHGPDEEGRKADLRLDTREGAFAERDGEPVIVAGRPAESVLWQRITTESRRQRMPPPRSKLSLSAEEQELIRRWIEEGAEWSGHWAYEPPRRPTLPTEVSAGDPIDHWIDERLERAGLEPAPAIGPERWIRRVTLDLTGLPPTLEEIDAFLDDAEPEAREKVIDRLLASSAYGERLAVDWLDVARFADTYGYQADRDSRLWPWRDWVIAAFNDDLPYDDFVAWQTAGDLLRDATREQRLATAFNRNHRQTNEGGSINEEFRVEYVADRVATNALAFLGLTIECARCHDHKYDPVTQRDYYRLFAFFNSTDESGLYSHFTDATPSPTLLLWNEGEEARHRALVDAIRSKESALRESRSTATARFDDWLDGAPQLDASAGLVGDFPFESLEGGKTPNRAREDRPGSLVEGPEPVEGRVGGALRFDGECSVTVSGVADFDRTSPFSIAAWLRIPEEREKIIVLHHSKAGSDAGSRGYELLLEDGRASFALIHFWPGNAIKSRTVEKLPLDTWVHVAVTYDGSSRADGIRLYVDGTLAATEIVRDRLFKDIGYGGGVPLTLGARFRGRGFKGGAIDELRVWSRAIAPLEVAVAAGSGSLEETLAAAKRGDAAARSVVREAWLSSVDSTTRGLEGELRELRAQESRLIEGVREVMVLGDLPSPRPTFVLDRGRYDAPRERVEPGTPEAILPFDEGWPRDRSGLARWLVDERNPLTARVTVNRLWQLVFGRGIVATPEDFGSQGEAPSHPRVLDTLAVDFVERGWSVKDVLRRIALTEVFARGTFVSEAGAERDPEARLLSRRPARRLSAEEIRDVVIAAAGVLDRRIGGDSVRGAGPIGFRRTDESPRAQPERHGYRRSLYSYVKRTAPDPLPITFDATSRETCIARRQVTNTPLQALALLNAELFQDLARLLSARMAEEGAADPSRGIERAFRRLAGRRPRAHELGVLRRLFDEDLEIWSASPGAAREYLDAGSWTLPDDVAPERLAAFSTVATAIIAFDETTMER